MDNSYDYATILDTPLRCSVLNNVYNKLCQHILGYFVSINDSYEYGMVGFWLP